ncbi:MAG: glycosyltransferase family 2 protein [Ruminococcaceae bacterium]|nr:glycosyltransferase family 2 protein [Oscillospiraceae bacterium]
MLSVLIPFYNEEQQIPITLRTVVPIIESVDPEFELVLVDDGSSDRTYEIINEAAVKDPRIVGLRFSRNFGKEAAIRAALDYASGDAVLLMDGDLQHPPEKIPEMVRLWRDEHYDVVEGVKTYRGKESFMSRLNAKIFYGLFWKTCGYDLRNASDFKLLDRRVVNEWRRLGERDTFFRGLSAWLGFRRTKFEFEVAERSAGGSKWSVFRLIQLSINAITGFSTMPLQLITYLGLLLLVGSVILAIKTLIVWFAGEAAGGITTVILLQLLIGGSIMLSLGLIGLYIARIFEEVKGRPSYIISETTREPRTRPTAGQ